MKGKDREKLEKITELIKKREEIEKEIEKMLNPIDYSLPDDFSVKDEVLAIFTDENRELKIKELLEIIKKRNKELNFNRMQITSCLNYLSNRKKMIIKTGYGKYKLKEIK